MFTEHLIRRACDRAADNAGSRIEIRTAMMPITTSSSTSVNPRERREEKGPRRFASAGELRRLDVPPDICAKNTIDGPHAKPLFAFRRPAGRGGKRHPVQRAR